MQNSDNHIDKLFRSKLENYSVKPPPEVWDKVSASLVSQGMRRRRALLWTFTAAASVLLAFVTGWFMSEKTFNTGIEHQLLSLKSEIRADQITPFPVESNIQIQFQLTPVKPLMDDYHAMVRTETSVYSSESTFNDVGMYEYAQMKDIFALTKGETSNAFSLAEMKSELLNDTDRAIIEANMLAMNHDVDQENQHSGWSVGLKASPMFSEDQPTMGLDYDKAFHSPHAYSSISTFYKPGVSGGVSVEFDAGNKISFVSGVNYNEISKGANDVAIAYAGHNWVNNMSGMDYLYGVESKVPHSSSAATTSIQTSSGVAIMNMPAGTQLATASRDDVYRNTLTQNYNYEQNAGYVEIPLLIRYNIIDKEFGMHLFGGINTNLLIVNNVKLSSQNQLIAQGEIDGLRPVTFSSSMGFGFNYKLFEVINLSLEPTLKLYLNNLNVQQAYSYRPFALGVYSGISYSF